MTDPRPTRVVIAEDEAIIRLDLKEILQEEGYEVVGETGRGDEAIELVRTLQPDLVILDIKMPGLDGLSAAREIAGDRLAAVLMVTAFSQRELVEQARDAGALAYLVKPFQKSDLIPAIEVALGRFAELTALERDLEDLQARLDARKVIDRAKGRLMDEHGMTEQDAWRFLQQQAMTNRVRNDEIARRVIDGELTPDCTACDLDRRRRRLRSPLMSTLLLIDGLSLAYRAFYALPADLATPEGTVTNAVFGFTSMLVKVLGDEHPDGIAVVFDEPGKNFRHELDADYKGTRKETPDLFVPQIPLIHEVIDALHIPTLQVPGVEADDVIATLATRAAADGIDVVIVTGDRDSYQLVSDPHVKVLYNRRGVSDYALYDEAGILERTKVTPAQYPEYAALRGDPSDNLDGVPGIGEKTAAKLVNTYGNLEGIYEHLDELPPKQRQNLGEARDRVFLNRQMSRLVLDVEVDVEPADLRMGAWDREEVRVLFDQLAFRTLLPRLFEAVGEQAADTEREVLDVEVVALRDEG